MMPESPDADQLFLSALEQQTKGDIELAFIKYQEILQHCGDHPDTLHHLGLIYLQKGDITQAISWIQKSLKVDPKQANAYSNLGYCLNILGKYNEAISACELACKHNSSCDGAWTNLGNSQRAIGLIESAKTSYRKALELQPNNPEYFYNLANVYLDQEHFKEAASLFKNSLFFQNQIPEAHNNLSVCLIRLRDNVGALEHANKSIELKPTYAEAWTNRGNALYGLQRFRDALESYVRAIELKPTYAEAWSNRGNVLNEIQRYREALDSHERAIMLDPTSAEAYSNQGITLNYLRRYKEALKSYDKAIELKPNYAEAFWNKSLVLLSLGNYEDGWQLYEWRWKRESFTSPKRNFAAQLWSGKENLEGKIILLHAEQGIGDTINFCRYTEMVAARGAKIILYVQKPLKELLKSLPKIDAIVEIGKIPPPVDFHIPIMSLPLAFGTTVNTIPLNIPYIVPDPLKVEKWGKRLGPKTRPRVGIVWSSTSSFKHDHLRSMSLEMFSKCLPANLLTLICLQKEIKECDKEVIMKRKDIIDISIEIEDFSDTAAIAAQLDLVISTCTSVPHLTGAMGIKTWVLLSHTPDFRWMFNRQDSPWYPSLRLFRQSRPGEWGDVLDEVAVTLVSEFLKDL